MGKLLTIYIVILFAITSASPSNEEIVNKINRGQKVWKAEHNYITRNGKTFMKKLLGTFLPKNHKNVERRKIVSNENIPGEFDARQQWPGCPSIGSIKDQGNCGSCWAVAAASSASDRLCISTNTESDLNLSAQNLMSCCFFCSILGGCNGGFPSNAWAYIDYFGIVTGGNYDSQEGCQPYQIPPASTQNSTPSAFIKTPRCHWTCTNPVYSGTYFRDKHHSQNYYTVAFSVSAIQTQIMTNGPVQASFEVYEDFMHYKSGVYIQTSNKYLGGHSVKLVGWGTDPVSQVNYWLAANSWNTTWGMDGWFMIRRGTNECGIEQYVTTGDF